LTLSTGDNGHFTLTGHLNRNTVPSFWLTALVDLAKQGAKANHQPVVLDLSAIEDVDTAGLAWLINLLKACRGQNIPLELQNIPETLINLAKISDVHSFLSVQ
jgi:phospholipid transport system transporter-binding protein